jgi:hypothetical protein
MRYSVGTGAKAPLGSSGAALNMTTTTAKLVFADEVGGRIAGFTVRGAAGVELCRTVEQLEAIGATAWATSVELLIWLSRTPEFWGHGTTSAKFKVWDWQAEQVREVTVPRKGCEAPLDREQLR